MADSESLQNVPFTYSTGITLLYEKVTSPAERNFKTRMELFLYGLASSGGDPPLYVRIRKS